MNKKLARQYITDIILIIVIISTLTWFWFGPCKNRIRIKESLMANNISFNKNIDYNGFGYLEITDKKITKELNITNNGTKSIDFIISYNNLNNNDKNNYINYVITDNEGYQSDIKSLSLDGYILENNIAKNETKKYTITIWSDSNLQISGNLEVIINSKLV